MIVLSAVEPVQDVQSDQSHDLWQTDLRVQAVPAHNAAKIYDMELDMVPHDHEQPLDMEEEKKAHAARRELAFRCASAQAGAISEIIPPQFRAGIAYDCSMDLFRFGFNYDFALGQAITPKLQLVEDVVYFTDT